MKVRWVALAALSLTAVWAAIGVQSAEQQSAASDLVRYDEEGNLLLPQGWDRWVLVGSSLGLGYSEGTPNPQEAFHNVLMEPSAYDRFQETGEFPEKTMLALVIYSQAQRESIARRGAYTKDFLALEIALKDHQRFEKGWAYFNFGLERPRSKAIASTSCYSCHNEHGQLDNVFVQFYPKLRPKAEAARLSAAERQEPSQPEAPAPRLALRGNDPVLLTKGEAVLGDEKFEAARGRFIYRFAGADSLAAFQKEPQRYAIQNEMCPVVPSAPANPDLYTVHQGKIYIFASESCIEDFKADPGRYLGHGG